MPLNDNCQYCFMFSEIKFKRIIRDIDSVHGFFEVQSVIKCGNLGVNELFGV